MTIPNVELARTLYASLRNYWVAGGGALEAHERLSLITVAAGAREFAFLTHLDDKSCPEIAQLLLSCGLNAVPSRSEMDFHIETEGVSPDSSEAYCRVIRERDSLSGLGVWGRDSKTECAGMTSLGTALSYPDCCHFMDLSTKLRDHELFLSSIVEAEGDDPSNVEQALRQRLSYSKTDLEHCHRWNERFFQTLEKYPFVIHTACDECLESDHNPTARLNKAHEELAESVSDELHLMLRWGARALSYSRNRGE